MPRLGCANLAALVLSLALAGCSVPGPAPVTDGGFHGRTAPAVTMLAGASAPPTVLDLTDVPSKPMPPVSARPERALGEWECLRLASANSTPANLLEQQSRECAATASAVDGVPCPGSMQSEILAVAALEVRNASAGGCMELYYQLAQAQAQRDVVSSALTMIDRAAGEGKLLTEKGVKVPGALADLERRAFALRDQQSELDRGVAQLSAELRQRLNLGPPDEEWLVRPTPVIKVDPTVEDTESVIRDGLARRPEMMLMRRLDGGQAPQTLRALKAALGAVNPLLTMACREDSPDLAALLHAALGHSGVDEDVAETTALRDMWDVYRLDREREVVKELRVAASDVHVRVNQLVHARDRLAYWRQRLERLRMEEAKGMPNYAERVEAELNVLDAESTAWEKLFAWQIATVKLRQARFTLLP